MKIKKKLVSGVRGHPTQLTDKRLIFALNFKHLTHETMRTFSYQYSLARGAWEPFQYTVLDFGAKETHNFVAANVTLQWHASKLPQNKVFRMC